MSAPLATAPSDGLLPALLSPVEALLARRAGPAGVEPLVELQQLGYLGDGADPGAWQQLGDADWFALLRAIARRCPRLAMALAAARLTVEIAGTPLAPDAIAVRAAYVRAHLADAGAPPMRVAAALLSSLSSGAEPDSPGVDPTVGEIGIVLPSAALQRVPRDLLVVASGTLWRLWNACAAHAESRPMFRRVLADFPVIRYRLLSALVAVLEAEEHADRAVADHDEGRPLAAFRAACLRVGTETQQLCGGSGFMRESDYAASLLQLDDCLRALGPLPTAASAQRDGAQDRVRDRLAAWGITAAECTALAAFGSRPRWAG